MWIGHDFLYSFIFWCLYIYGGAGWPGLLSELEFCLNSNFQLHSDDLIHSVGFAYSDNFSDTTSIQTCIFNFQ